MKSLFHLAAVAAFSLLGLGAHAQTLSYLGQQIVPTGTPFQGAAVGGLSSLDYNPATGRYLAISDDRSEVAPARFYELALDLSQFRRTATPGSDGVRFVAMTTIQDLDGRPFGRNRVDPEGLRLDARRQLIYWCNEGQRKNGDFQAPTVRRMKPDGAPAGAFPVPSHYLPAGSVGGIAAGDMGVYNNLAFESIALTPDGKTLWTITENALAQDDLPTAVNRPSRARMLSFDLDTGAAGAEYVYEVGPVVFAPAKAGDFATNGVADLLALSDHQFIAIERSFAVGAATPGHAALTGRPTSNTIRLFLIDTTGATNVAGWPTLKGRDVVLARRQLLLDLSTLKNDDGTPLAVDNIEGITFGPTVNGKRTLVLVSDNNFNPEQFTQFVALTLD
ncbi:esterase-like activity of phytase family protein [Roseateles sp. BYS87W]|uniref:Esterase-like activity of phytase family protein n=1 Tax=Pelomonas baiyunensis TaxID=3299026 RepID=A0ABW7GXL1_9BURK